jgi:hypothetical protein
MCHAYRAYQILSLLPPAHRPQVLYFTLPLVSYQTPIRLLGLLVESDQTARTLLRLKHLVQKKMSKISPSLDFVKLLMSWRNLNKHTD